MKKFVLAIILLALCSLSFAATMLNTQEETTAAVAKKGAAGIVPVSSFATNSCSFNFMSGANNTFLQYCVTVNGNIMQIVTPAVHAQITFLTDGEGYGICDVTNSGITGYADYSLQAGTTANWNAATLVSQTATAVKISRDTSDGIWTLTQTITQVASSASIKIVMALRNNTAANRDVFFLRYADADADAAFLNNLDGTHNTAMAGIPPLLVRQSTGSA